MTFLLHCASNDKRGPYLIIIIIIIIIIVIIIIIIIIINGVYPRSSTHSKVVFREVLHAIEFEFGNVDF